MGRHLPSQHWLLKVEYILLRLAATGRSRNKGAVAVA
jgi:hypothetical protein